MKRMTEAQLKEHLEALSKLGAPDLRAEWAKVYGTPAPRRISRDLLVRAIAYRIQEKMYGGLKPATVKRLKQIAADMEKGTETPQKPTASLREGVRLLREWNGETHIVEVVPDGFAWRGNTYKSLSVIARAITGANWSGPKFFGLRDKRRSESRNPADVVARPK